LAPHSDSFRGLIDLHTLSPVESINGEVTPRGEWPGRVKTLMANTQAEYLSLFRGLLSRWIERAGFVDVCDLVIAEAEHLAEDFVGVFAEQW